MTRTFPLLLLLSACGTLQPLQPEVSEASASYRSVNEVSLDGLTQLPPNALTFRQRTLSHFFSGTPYCVAAGEFFASYEISVSCTGNFPFYYASPPQTAPAAIDSFVKLSRDLGVEVTLQNSVSVSLLAPESEQSAGGTPAQLSGVPSPYNNPELQNQQVSDLLSVGFSTGSVGNYSIQPTVLESYLRELGLPGIVTPRGSFSQLVAPDNTHAVVRTLDELSVRSHVFMTTGLTQETVGGLSAAFPDAKLFFEPASNRLTVTTDQLEPLLPALRPYLVQPREIAIRGAIVEFSDSRGTSGSLTLAGTSGSFTVNGGSGGALVLGSNGLEAGLSLARSLGQVSILAKPSLTVSNGQTAEFLSGQKLPLPTSTTVDGVTNQSFQYVDVGYKLSATAHVGDDGTITLSLDLESSSASPSETAAPVLNTRSVSTKLRLLPGQTAVISGLSDSTETLNRTVGLPTSGSRRKTNSEVLFLVTVDLLDL